MLCQEVVFSRVKCNSSTDTLNLIGTRKRWPHVFSLVYPRMKLNRCCIGTCGFFLFKVNSSVGADHLAYFTWEWGNVHGSSDTII